MIVRKAYVLKTVLLMGLALFIGGNVAFANENSQAEDAAITAKVKAQLLRQADISSVPISVSTENGKVRLTGEVSSKEEAKKAERVAKSVNGVSSVENDLSVSRNDKGRNDKGGVAQYYNDSVITSKVKAQLLAAKDMPATSIQVSTQDDGVVTLTGKVDSSEQKRRAESIAKQVTHVKKVKNNLTVVDE